MSENEIPEWALPGLERARLAADRLIAEQRTGSDTWDDEHADWYVTVHISFREEPVAGGYEQVPLLPTVRVTADRADGRYDFARRNNTEWSLMRSQL